MSDADGDLDDVLAPQPGKPSAALRDRLLQLTESRLVRRRWVRRGGRAALISGAFATGLAMGWMARPMSAPNETQVVQVMPPEIVGVPVPIPVLVPSPVDSAGPSAAAAVAASGPELELQAEQADGPAAASLYKAAGDAFLRAEDYPNATRCYRVFLVRSGDAALSLAPEDSWLLTSLKNAAFQEKSRVQKTD